MRIVFIASMEHTRMNDQALCDRLRRWAAGAAGQVRRSASVYAIVWQDVHEERLIEVFLAYNGVAARTGKITNHERERICLEPDKQAMTSWHCAPYTQMEDLLGKLRAARVTRYLP